MKIGIIGAGALGSFLGGVLAKHNDVLIVGKNEKDIDDIEISGKTNLDVEVDYTTDYSRTKKLELVIICTKSYDTRSAMDDLTPYLDGSTYVMTLQNGLDNEKIISEYIDEDKVIGGITGIGVTYLKPGKVKHAGEGETIIGAFRNTNDKMIYDTKDILEKSGLKVSISDNIYSQIWKKVIINSSINPITALTGLKNGYLVEHEYLNELLKKVCLESKIVAEKEVELPIEDMVKETEKNAKMRAENRSSMLQDIVNENKTEIECINGAIVAMSKKLDIDTAYNQTMYNPVKGKESGYF